MKLRHKKGTQNDSSPSQKAKPETPDEMLIDEEETKETEEADKTANNFDAKKNKAEIEVAGAVANINNMLR